MRDFFSNIFPFVEALNDDAITYLRLRSSTRIGGGRRCTAIDLRGHYLSKETSVPWSQSNVGAQLSAEEKAAVKSYRQSA